MYRHCPRSEIRAVSGNIIRRHKMFKKIINKFVSLFPQKLQDIYYKNEEVIMYLFFGVLTTAVSFVSAGVSKLIMESYGFSKDAVSILSTAISWVCAVTFAYITNRIWVFSSQAKTKKELVAEALSFYGGRGFTFVAEIVMMYLGYSLMGFNYWITKIAANVIVLILNYVISKIFVFRKKNNEELQK
jgi:putative flippase GtrA